jgi:hypothetical protein
MTKLGTECMKKKQWVHQKLTHLGSDETIILICETVITYVASVTYPESPRITSFSICFFEVIVVGDRPAAAADLPA